MKKILSNMLLGTIVILLGMVLLGMVLLETALTIFREKH